MAFNSRRLAVLIDGDSIDSESLGRVMTETRRHGDVAIRRIYGNAGKLSDWGECIRRHEIESIPNSFSYKNAANVALIIDAVEILHSGKGINGFCIVTSDNDFAVLVKRFRNDGIFVAGIGRSKTPPLSFKEECNVFMYVEDLPRSDNPHPTSREVLSG